MQITTIGLDIAKNVFQVHGIDATEKVVVRKQPRRSQVLAFFKALPSAASTSANFLVVAAGLYAPLRVILYEDETGGSIFEYDRPSSFFGQYGDERVTEVGRYLDATLEATLRNAAE